MRKDLIIIVICILLLAGAIMIFRDLTLDSNDIYGVQEVIDGDTIRLSTGERVRLIGINTPETGQPYYDDATLKLEELIGENSVILKKDVEDKDQYGRWLRYVYVNDTFVNLEMVRQGMAIAYEFEPNVKHSDEFYEAEDDARNNQIGIWTPSSFTLTISQIHADAEGDDSANLNDEYVVFENNKNTSIAMTGWTLQDESNNYFVFPDFILENETSVTVYTGSGEDTETRIYWGSTKPIWNNQGDALFLRDSGGLLVSFQRY
jgi:endonuclease YncB( thermonuclease family)